MGEYSTELGDHSFTDIVNSVMDQAFAFHEYCLLNDGVKFQTDKEVLLDTLQRAAAVQFNAIAKDKVKNKVAGIVNRTCCGMMKHNR